MPEVQSRAAINAPVSEAGRAIARAVKPLVGVAVQHTTANLVGRFED